MRKIARKLSWKTKNNGPSLPSIKGIVKRDERDMRIYIHVLSKSINKELFPSPFCFFLVPMLV
jgi:hypothetical protein